MNRSIKNRIIREALILYLRYGIRNTTMDQLATHLSISKRTIYENFKDKDELVGLCIDLITTEQRQAYDAIIDEADNVIDAILNFFQHGMNSFRLINYTFHSDLKKYYPKIWSSKIIEIKQYQFNATYKLLRRGINEKIFRKDLHIEIVAKIFMEQINLITDSDIFPPEQYSKAAVFENMAVSFIRGICSAKGLELIGKFLK